MMRPRGKLLKLRYQEDIISHSNVRTHTPTLSLCFPEAQLKDGSHWRVSDYIGLPPAHSARLFALALGDGMA